MSLDYPSSTPDIVRKRRELGPDQQAAFDAFSKAVFADGALSAKTKQIVAVAVAHVTQCPYCIQGHTRAALRAGATFSTVSRISRAITKRSPRATVW